MNDEQFGENMEQDTSDAVIKFKDAVSEEKISVSAYLHSIKIGYIIDPSHDVFSSMASGKSLSSTHKKS